VKDFDEARRRRAEQDREFTIGGERFVMRAGVRPEVLAPYEGLTADTSPTESLQIIDELVMAFVEPTDDAARRWVRLRERDDDPVTLQDLTELVQWLVEGQTGRPTVPPSPSTRSSEISGT